jgi:hypothetical protein
MVITKLGARESRRMTGILAGGGALDAQDAVTGAWCFDLDLDVNIGEEEGIGAGAALLYPGGRGHEMDVGGAGGGGEGIFEPVIVDMLAATAQYGVRYLGAVGRDEAERRDACLGAVEAHAHGAQAACETHEADGPQIAAYAGVELTREPASASLDSIYGAGVGTGKARIHLAVYGIGAAAGDGVVRVVLGDQAPGPAQVGAVGACSREFGEGMEGLGNTEHERLYVLVSLLEGDTRAADGSGANCEAWVALLATDGGEGSAGGTHALSH